jgi:hypothetical protein
MTELTPKQAYLAMFSFLEAHYRRSEADDIAALLGSMSMLPDGTPADPAIERDWLAAVQAARAGEVSASMELSK